MTTKHGTSKVALVCTSFLAFAALTAFVSARHPTSNAASAQSPVTRRVEVREGRVLVPRDSQPVTRSRGS